MSSVSFLFILCFSFFIFLSNSGVRELEINFPLTHVTCIFYVAVQSKKKKKFSFPAYVFSFCIVVLFFFYSKKKKKKSSACLCLIWKQNKPFFKWFSLAFSRTDLDSINDLNEFLLPIVSAAAAVLFYRSDSGLRHCRSTAVTPTLAQSCRRPHQLCTI
jgi:hypothetical protein